MKNKILFIFISLFALFIGFDKIRAYEMYSANGITIDEALVEQKILELDPTHDFSEMPYVVCYLRLSPNSFACRFLSTEDQIVLGNWKRYDYYLYILDVNINNNPFTYSTSGNSYVNWIQPSSLTNITYFSNYDTGSSDISNVLKFSWNNEVIEEPEEELSILSISTENLSFILGKAEDICFYLFTQELFLMCLSVVLFYIVFLLICKFKR